MDLTDITKEDLLCEWFDPECPIDWEKELSSEGCATDGSSVVTELSLASRCWRGEKKPLWMTVIVRNAIKAVG